MVVAWARCQRRERRGLVVGWHRMLGNNTHGERVAAASMGCQGLCRMRKNLSGR